MAIKICAIWAVMVAALVGVWPAFASADQQTAGWEDITFTMKAVAMHSPPKADTDGWLGSLRFVAGYELHSPHRAFGGLSGLEISGDGQQLLGISDKGQWLWLQFDLKGDIPNTVDKARMAPMLDEEGNPLSRGKDDSESLVLADGQAFVGFESHDLVRSFPLSPESGTELSGLDSLAATRGSVLDLPAEMLRHPRNGGLEAMVRLEDGSLLAFSEKGRGADGHLKVWLYKDGKAQALFFNAPKDFYPTAAALLPDNDLLVLLRHFSLWGGFAARIVRISAENIVPGGVLTGEIIASLHPPLSVDNMEGLAVRRGGDGDLLLYLISDDNFFPLQRTLLLIYALPD